MRLFPIVCVVSVLTSDCLAAVQRVLLIQRALVIGFSLADLKRVLGVRDKGGAPCGSVRQLVGERLEELNRKISFKQLSRR